MKKTCYMCGETYPIEEGFHINRALKDGRCNLCKSCNSRKASTWKKDNPERTKNTHYENKYGITYLEYLKLISDQKGCCKICGVEESEASRKRLFVDHDHGTGEVRGLLCHHCNSGLGYFLDNVDLLSAAMRYLKDED